MPLDPSTFSLNPFQLSSFEILMNANSLSWNISHSIIIPSNFIIIKSPPLSRENVNEEKSELIQFSWRDIRSVYVLCFWRTFTSLIRGAEAKQINHTQPKKISEAALKIFSVSVYLCKEFSRVSLSYTER